MNQEDVIKKLRVYIAENHNGKQMDYAESSGFSKAMISAVLLGNRLPNNAMLGHLGLKKEKKIIYKYTKA